MIVTHIHAENQGQRSVGLKDRVKMEGDDHITPMLMQSVTTDSTDLPHADNTLLFPINHHTDSK